MTSSRTVALLLILGFTSITPCPSWAQPTVPSQVQTPPRDPRPGAPRPVSSREAELKQLTSADGASVDLWIELARLQEDRGAIQDAEQTLLKALAARGRERGLLILLSGFYNRQGDFEKCIAALEEAAAVNPTDAQGHQLVATYYFEKASKDERLAPAERGRYADLGIAAADRALAIHNDYFEALSYKNLLLRVKAKFESNAFVRDALIAEADSLRNRAIELNKVQRSTSTPVGAAPPPPPPPPPSEPMLVDGVAPARVGGNIKAPTKIYDQRPTYPEEALRERVTGMVILEAVIDTNGVVRSAKVLRSIPLLDAAAVEAVKAWRFAPAVRDGVAIPVVMTVTVNFTLQ